MHYQLTTFYETFKANSRNLECRFCDYSVSFAPRAEAATVAISTCLRNDSAVTRCVDPIRIVFVGCFS